LQSRTLQNAIRGPDKLERLLKVKQRQKEKEYTYTYRRHTKVGDGDRNAQDDIEFGGEEK